MESREEIKQYSLELYKEMRKLNKKCAWRSANKNIS
jgi:hypothetical protein